MGVKRKFLGFCSERLISILVALWWTSNFGGKKGPSEDAFENVVNDRLIKMKRQQQNQYLLDRKNGMRNCRMENLKTHTSLGLAQGKGH